MVRSDMDFLVRIFDQVIKAGARTSTPDTVSCSIPALWAAHEAADRARARIGQGSRSTCTTISAWRSQSCSPR
jgi:hypothetical protein